MPDPTDRHVLSSEPKQGHHHLLTGYIYQLPVTAYFEQYGCQLSSRQKVICPALSLFSFLSLCVWWEQFLHYHPNQEQEKQVLRLHPRPLPHLLH